MQNKLKLGPSESCMKLRTYIHDIDDSELIQAKKEELRRKNSGVVLRKKNKSGKVTVNLERSLVH